MNDIKVPNEGRPGISRGGITGCVVCGRKEADR